MANLKISALTNASTPLAGTEVLPIVQSSTTKKVATNDLTVKNVRSNATTGILQISGPAAASTRVMTVPDANFTAARTDAAQSFTGTQTISGSANVKMIGGAVSFDNPGNSQTWNIGAQDSLSAFYINNASAGTTAGLMDNNNSWLVGTSNNYLVNAVGCIFVKGQYVWANDNTGSSSNRNWSAGVNGYAAGSWQLTVSSANNSWPNAAYVFAVTSGGACYNTTGTYGTMSDARFKENVADARSYLDDLMKLRVVKYSLKSEESPVATKLGLIAQEVEQVFPGIIDVGNTSQGEEYKSIKMSILIPMLLQAVQELKQEINLLRGA